MHNPSELRSAWHRKVRASRIRRCGMDSLLDGARNFGASSVGEIGVGRTSAGTDAFWVGAGALAVEALWTVPLGG
jgi:hypothetical protein